ncbi:MAG: DUF1638 domain-containing protein [Deltaproteobacteria bacterium]|nr:DUF1638 domain-containing protein [Deltaproteobacteria bacterium]
MEHPAKASIISCGILKREIQTLVERGELDADVTFLSERLHSSYERLDLALNAAIRKLRDAGIHEIVLVYGDLCLGFHGEMESLLKKHDVVKVEALNCIDCLLGGRGKLLEIDPDHEYFFLNPAFIAFSEGIQCASKEQTRDMFAKLKGMILLDALGDLDEYKTEIEAMIDRTGLQVLERRNVGLEGLKRVLCEALQRR